MLRYSLEKTPLIGENIREEDKDEIMKPGEVEKKRAMLYMDKDGCVTSVQIEYTRQAKVFFNNQECHQDISIIIVIGKITHQ